MLSSTNSEQVARAAKYYFAWGLFLAEDDSASCQVVGGEFYLDFVAWKDADEMLSHFAGDVAEDFA